MFRIKQDGNIKVSFRSKGKVDVSSLAAQFGGGGHVNAAGCTIGNVSLEEARKKIKEAAVALLGQSGQDESTGSRG